MLDFRDWQGKAVLDREGHKIGSIGQLYVDDRNDAPAWATVRTQSSENFFPVSMAHVQGEDIVVDMPEDEVKNAPRIAADEQIGTAEEQELYQYYRDKWSDMQTPSDVSNGDTNRSQDDPGCQSRNTDDSMTDSEHQNVHLRRYTVTELVTDDGEVQHKKVVIERQPVDENELDQPTSDRQMPDEDRRMMSNPDNATDYQSDDMDDRDDQTDRKDKMAF